METPELIGGFRQKFEKFIFLYKNTKEENIELKRENEKFRKILEQKESIINELNEKIEKINLTKTFLGVSDNSIDAKNKITRIIREIDNCIALLNR